MGGQVLMSDERLRRILSRGFIRLGVSSSYVLAYGMEWPGPLNWKEEQMESDSLKRFTHGTSDCLSTQWAWTSIDRRSWDGSRPCPAGDLVSLPALERSFTVYALDPDEGEEKAAIPCSYALEQEFEDILAVIDL